MKKYKLTTNFGLKIIALVFSVFLWMIVVNVDNPVGTSTFTNIPVEIVNDDIITSSGEVYQVIGDDTVSVVVSANREIRQKLSADDIVATADVSEMDTSTNLIPVTITIPDYSGHYESAVAVPRNIRIQREKSGSKVLALTADTSGIVPRNGYTIGDVTVNPEKVTITGPESALKQIDKAVARVEMDGISKDTELDAELIFYDSDGNELAQSQLENNLGDDGLTVSIEVLKEKSVPIVFSVSGTPADGYKYTGCTSEPETVLVCGRTDEVEKLNSISVPASVINISGAQEAVERTVDITPYLPDGIRLVDEKSSQIKVTAKIEEEGTKMIDLLVSSIKIEHLADDLQVDYEPGAKISLQFRGDEAALDVLDIQNAVSVDLSEYTKPGTYEVSVEVNVPDGITMTSDATVSLTLEEKQQQTDDESEDSTSSDQQDQ